MADAPLLLVRADAGTAMGTGHVMRGLALAQAWQDAGGRAVLAAQQIGDALAARLRAHAVEVLAVDTPAGSRADSDATAALARARAAAWVALDGYQFDSDFHARLQDAGHRVLAIDDYGHAGRYPADVVLNQNLGADEATYAGRGAATRLLLGPRYALLRREFAAWRGRRREIPAVARKLLVTLGGADPGNVTLKVIEALPHAGIDGLEAEVLVGGSNPHFAALERTAAASPVAVRLRRDVTNVAELMAWADLAIAAGGTTSYERALLGLPGLVLVLAENQRGVAAACAAAGWCRNLGDAAALAAGDLASALADLAHDAATRQSQSAAAGRVVDGYGGARAVAALLGRPEPLAVALRPVTADDAHRVWEWANEPASRAASFASDAIPWDTHQRWFAARLAHPNCRLWIAAAPQPFGLLRFDAIEGGKAAVVSINLAATDRGRGTGTALLSLGCERLFAEAPAVVRLDAYVKPDNEPSRRLFLRCGFAYTGRSEVRGQPADLFQRHRPAATP